jgi:ATP-dependent Clp protease ATP-binding subunit ClpA
MNTTSNYDKVMATAQAIARELKSNVVAPEHILIAIIRNDDHRSGFILRLLAKLNGVSYLEFVTALLLQVPRGITEVPADAQLSFTPRASGLIATSKTLAKKRKDYCFDTIHLLLAITQDANSVACKLLLSHGITSKLLISVVGTSDAEPRPKWSAKITRAFKGLVRDELSLALNLMPIRGMCPGDFLRVTLFGEYSVEVRE